LPETLKIVRQAVYLDGGWRRPVGGEREFQEDYWHDGFVVDLVFTVVRQVKTPYTWFICGKDHPQRLWFI
jgi:hypothetical protein